MPTRQTISDERINDEQYRAACAQAATMQPPFRVVTGGNRYHAVLALLDSADNRRKFVGTRDPRADQYGYARTATPITIALTFCKVVYTIEPQRLRDGTIIDKPVTCLHCLKQLQQLGWVPTFTFIREETA